MDDALTLVAKHKAKQARQRELLRQRYQQQMAMLAEALAMIAAANKANGSDD
jgi:hypothetical protein